MRRGIILRESIFLVQGTGCPSSVLSLVSRVKLRPVVFLSLSCLRAPGPSARTKKKRQGTGQSDRVVWRQHHQRAPTVRAWCGCGAGVSACRSFPFSLFSLAPFFSFPSTMRRPARACSYLTGAIGWCLMSLQWQVGRDTSFAAPDRFLSSLFVREILCRKVSDWRECFQRLSTPFSPGHLPQRPYSSIPPKFWAGSGLAQESCVGKSRFSLAGNTQSLSLISRHCGDLFDRGPRFGQAPVQTEGTKGLNNQKIQRQRVDKQNDMPAGRRHSTDQTMDCPHGAFFDKA